MTTITAIFETRRDADLAVEHLVQEHDVDRGDIALESASDDNSAGNAAGGADLARDYEEGSEDDAALDGGIKITATLDDDERVEDVADVLQELGASDLMQD